MQEASENKVQLCEGFPLLKEHKSISNWMSHKICKNAKLTSEKIPIVFIPGQFQVTSNLK